MAEPRAPEVASAIDHTLLKPDARREDVLRVCEEAREHRFAGVCVAGTWIPLVVEALEGSGVLAVAVAGFPLGTERTSVKAYETAELVNLGAEEVDTVIHLGHAKAGAWAAVGADLEAVVRAAGGRPVKAILEVALLDEEEVVSAARAAVAAGAAFVKTSTGFGPGGATVEAVRLMRQTVGPEVGVKAAGGIRSLTDARAMLAAGANRLGTSSGLVIVGA